MYATLSSLPSLIIARNCTPRVLLYPYGNEGHLDECICCVPDWLVYGARPLKRVIQKELQDPLARLLLEGRIHDGETIEIGVEGDQLSINGVPNGFAKGAAALN